MKDERRLRPAILEHLDHQARHPRIGGTHRQSLGACWVGERAQEVEDGSDPERPAHRSGVAHRGVVLRCKEEPETDGADHLHGSLRAHLEVDPERLEQVGGAGLRGSGSVAVFGDLDAGAGGNERGRRRDIECARPIATRANAVDDRFAHIDGDRGLRHRVNEPGHLVGGLAFCPQRHQERRDLSLRGVAGHDLGHGGMSLSTTQPITGKDLLEHGGPGEVGHSTPNPTQGSWSDRAEV